MWKKEKGGERAQSALALPPDDKTTNKKKNLACRLGPIACLLYIVK
jgi:hypothetical protein